jgi:hypothetical protein
MKPIVKSINTLSLFVVLIMISFSSFAQNFKLGDLQGKTWCMQGLTDKTFEEIYENNKITSYLSDKYIYRMEYYLSDSIVKVFDSSKVGIVKEGKYIIRRPLRDKKYPTVPLTVSVYEIKELTPTKLTYRYIKNPYLLEFKAK